MDRWWLRKIQNFCHRWFLFFFWPNRTLKKKKKTGPVDRFNASVRPAKNKNVKITRRFWLLQWQATATVIGFSVDAWWTAPIEWVLWKRNLALAVFKKQTSRRRNELIITSTQETALDGKSIVCLKKTASVFWVFARMGRNRGKE